MAVSASSGRRLDVDTIIRRALQLAGLLNYAQRPGGMPNGTEMTSMARDFLETELDALEAEGTVLRYLAFTTLTTVSSNDTSTLPSTALDVMGQMMITTSAGAETPIEPIFGDEWLTIPNKTAAGRPTRFYLERNATPLTVKWWPVPDAAYTIRYRVKRLGRDIDAGNVDVDLEQYWMKYVLHALATYLARSSSMGMDRVLDLQAQATEAKRIAKGFNRPHGPMRVRLMHRGPWR